MKRSPLLHHLAPGEYNFLLAFEEREPLIEPKPARGVFIGLAIAIPLWGGLVALARWWIG